MIPKKFLEDGTNSEFVSKKIQTNNLYGLSSKNYMFDKNCEEEIIEIKNHTDNKKEILNSLTTVDFRVFDNNMLLDKITVFIYHEYPESKLISFFKSMNYQIVEINREYLTKTSEHIENSSILEREIIFFQFLETYLDNLQSSEKSKYFIYMDLDESDMSLFLLLNFFKKLNKKNVNKVAILTDNSIISLLGNGMNHIFLSDNLFTGKGVGLLPLENTKISTKGLKWDVTDWETNFGSLNLSTSNEILDFYCNIFVHYGCIAFTAEININKL